MDEQQNVNLPQSCPSCNDNESLTVSKFENNGPKGSQDENEECPIASVPDIDNNSPKASETDLQTNRRKISKSEVDINDLEASKSEIDNEPVGSTKSEIDNAPKASKFEIDNDIEASKTEIGDDIEASKSEIGDDIEASKSEIDNALEASKSEIDNGPVASKSQIGNNGLKSSKSQNDQLVTMPDLAFPGVDLNYINGQVNSLEIKSPQTPQAMSTLLTQNTFIESATFYSGLIKSPQRLQFHDRIPLPFLQKLTIATESQTDPASKSILSEFKRLFYFLKEIEYEKLETLEILFPVEWVVHIPWATAIIPSYEYEDSHPVADLIRYNRDTIQNIYFGPEDNRMHLKLNPKACSKICEPRNYPQLEIFEGSPNCFTLPSLSAILKPQKHLTKLSLAFTNPSVWNDISSAIRLSSDTLQIIDIKAFSGEPAILNVRCFKNCNKLTRLSFRYIEFSIIGWNHLPKCVTSLGIGGPISYDEVLQIARTLPILEEVHIDMRSSYYPSTIRQPVNIVQHPFFEFIKTKFETLKEFSVKYHDIRIAWKPLEDWVESQSQFKLVEFPNSKISLINQSPISTWLTKPENNLEGVISNKNVDSSITPRVPEVPTEDNNITDESYFDSCLGMLAWRDRYF